MITYRDLIDAVLTRASLESGVDTQVYSDGPVGQMIQSTFDTLFDMFWWPEYYVPADTSFVLDGTTGKTTVNPNTVIKRWVDLRYVWLSNYGDPLPRAPLRVNPSQIRAQCVGPDANNIFRVYPPTTNTSMTLAYRTRPAPFMKDNDPILLDSEMMILGTAYDYVNSLGLNPGAEDKLQQKFQNRIQVLMNENMNMDVGSGGDSALPTSWSWY